MLMQYEGKFGEHVEVSADNAIRLAAKYNRKVRMPFNGIMITVNKRLSVKHVVGTWQHMIESRALMYRNSPAARAAKVKRQAEIDAKQIQLDELMMNLPTKKNAATWIAQWVPLSDDVAVDRRGELVAESLRSIGFVSGQHVGDPDLKDGTATKAKRVEYIAGQVISMLGSVGCVHPMIGEWAAKSAKSNA